MKSFIAYPHIFYDRSSTYMGLLYSIPDGMRSDWGKIELLLNDGESINIRPATRTEFTTMWVRLEHLIDDMFKEGWVQHFGNFDKDNPPEEAIRQREENKQIPRAVWFSTR